MERCLHQAAAPLLDMLRRWLFEGRLAATPGDFFIVSSPFPKGARLLSLPVCSCSSASESQQTYLLPACCLSSLTGTQ